MSNREILYQQKSIQKEGSLFDKAVDKTLELGRIALVFLCVYSTVWCFMTGMGLKMDNHVCLMYVVGVIVLVYLLYLLKLRFEWSVWITIPLFFITYGFVVYHYFEEIMEGFYIVVSRFIQMANEYYKVSLIVPDALTEGFDASAIDGFTLLMRQVYCQTIFITTVFVLIAAIVSVIYYNGMGVFFYLLYTAPFVVTPLALGHIPNTLAFILYISSTVVVIGSVRKQKGMKDRNIQSKVMLVMASFCFVSICLIYAIYPETTYKTQFDLKQTKIDLQRKVNDISNIKLFSDMTTEQWMKYHFSKGIDYGRLGNKDELKFNNTVALNITMNGQALGDEAKYFYLKGFVGERYAGDYWEPYNAANIPGYESDVEDLRQMDIEKEDVNRNFVECLNKVQFGQLKKMIETNFATYSKEKNILGQNIMDLKKIHINNVAAGKGRTFLPYFMDGVQSLDENGRMQLLNHANSNGNEYDVSFYSNITNWVRDRMVNQDSYEFLLYTDSIINDFKDIDSVIKMLAINEFVRKHYLTIPDQVQSISFKNVMNLLVDTMGEEVAREYKRYYMDKHDEDGDAIEDLSEWMVIEEYYDEEGYYKKTMVLEDDSTWDEDTRGFLESFSKENLNEIIAMVQKHLWEQTKYTLAPGRTPKGKDFVDYFMMENKKGYCVHYATTATLLFRALGVPARMVEGYVISPDAIVKAKEKAGVGFDEREFTVQVLDSNAHAWVEVYIDNVGWIPVEVTPASGLSTVEETPLPTEGPTPPITEETPSVSPIEQDEPDDNPPMPTLKPEDPKSGESDFKNIIYANILKIIQRYVNAVSNRGVAYFATITALLYSILTILSIRKRIFKIYRTKVLPNRTTKRRVSFLYQRLVLAFRLYGVVYERQSVDQYAEELIDKFGFLGLVDARTTFLEGVFKNIFSKEPLSEEECQVVEEFYEAFCEKLYQHVNTTNRWYMENILCLY